MIVARVVIHVVLPHSDDADAVLEAAERVSERIAVDDELDTADYVVDVEEGAPEVYRPTMHDGPVRVAQTIRGGP